MLVWIARLAEGSESRRAAIMVDVINGIVIVFCLPFMALITVGRVASCSGTPETGAVPVSAFQLNADLLRKATAVKFGIASVPRVHLIADAKPDILADYRIHIRPFRDCTNC